MHRLTLFAALIVAGTLLTAQDIGSILEAHYKAASLEKMSRVETIIVSGTNNLAMAGIESTFTAYQARPNLVRAEGEFQGSKVIQTYNGEQGWIYAPMMGIPEPKEMAGDELNALLSQAEFENALWNYAEKGHTIELETTQEDENTYQLKLTTSNGDVQYYFIDRETHLINAIHTSQVMGGSENEIEILMSGYKNVKGIPVAHKLVTKMNGQVVTTLLIKKVEYNKKIDPSLFEKPAVE